MAERYKRKSNVQKTGKNRVTEITEKLEQGIQELFESERYQVYLKTMAKFYYYSINNEILIAMQRPDATRVAGYHTWQKLGRYVKAGERGICILAPMPYKVKLEKELTDLETGQTIKNENGDPVTEVVDGKRLYGFRVVTVFDISQTAGEELPSLGVEELSGSVERYDEFLEAIRAVSPVLMEWEKIPGSAKGYYSRSEQRIAIQEGMSQIQTIKTAIHELAHAKLHGPESEEETELQKKTRETKEVEAESVAYTICQRYGIETSDYSFGYIAGWSSGKELKELKNSLETIRKTSAELIQSLDMQLQLMTEVQSIQQTAELVTGGEVPSATFALSMT